jgi:hypothetical protein
MSNRSPLTPGMNIEICETRPMPAAPILAPGDQSSPEEWRPATLGFVAPFQPPTSQPGHVIERQRLVNKILNYICIFVAVSHTAVKMKKANNPKSQMKVEAKEHAGVPVARDSEAKSATVELATPLTAEEKQHLAKLGDFFEVWSLC